jgi:hypothetical protein
MYRLLFEVPSAVIVLLSYILPVIGNYMPLKVPLGPTSNKDKLLKEPVSIHRTDGQYNREGNIL